MKGGDKNNMESEIEITGSDTKGTFEKIKDWSYENWQTILVVLIVLIVGISAYNYNQQNNTSSPAVIVDDDKPDESNQEIGIENENAEENVEENIEENNQEATAENNDQEVASQEDNGIISDENKEIENKNTNEENLEEVLSSSDDSGKVYTITANKGEGITHLARKALDKYLQENNIDLNKEQKIYAEDYMQNRTGSEEIEIGNQKTFSENLIKTAISNANNLSEKSLENLKKYTK